jgi:hypothetical protein
MRRLLPAVVLLALVSPARPVAHQLDEYLQAARVAFTRDRVVLEIDLTPGANIFSAIMAVLDRDADGVVQPLEARAYGETVIDDVDLTFDERPVRLLLSTIEVPSVAEMRVGSGTMQLIAEGSIGTPRSGTHHLRFRNHHHPAGSVYLANALVPGDRDIQVVGQRRDRLQQQLDVEYTVASRWSRNLVWVLFGATLVISRIAVRRA